MKFRARPLAQRRRWAGRSDALGNGRQNTPCRGALDEPAGLRSRSSFAQHIHAARPVDLWVQVRGFGNRKHCVPRAWVRARPTLFCDPSGSREAFGRVTVSPARGTALARRWRIARKGGRRSRECPRQGLAPWTPVASSSQPKFETEQSARSGVHIPRLVVAWRRAVHLPRLPCISSRQRSQIPRSPT